MSAGGRGRWDQIVSDASRRVRVRIQAGAGIDKHLAQRLATFGNVIAEHLLAAGNRGRTNGERGESQPQSQRGS